MNEDNTPSSKMCLGIEHSTMAFGRTNLFVYLFHCWKNCRLNSIQKNMKKSNRKHMYAVQQYAKYYLYAQILSNQSFERWHRWDGTNTLHKPTYTHKHSQRSIVRSPFFYFHWKKIRLLIFPLHLHEWRSILRILFLKLTIPFEIQKNWKQFSFIPFVSHNRDEFLGVFVRVNITMIYTFIQSHTHTHAVSNRNWQCLVYTHTAVWLGLGSMLRSNNKKL